MNSPGESICSGKSEHYHTIIIMCYCILFMSYIVLNELLCVLSELLCP